MTELDLSTLRRHLRRRRRAGMTLVEIMIVVIIMALIATGVAVAVMPQLERAKIRDTQTGVAAVRGAAEMYLADSPGNDCPSVEDLVEGGFLNRNTRTTDAWDNEFSIECDGTDVIVTSAGPDGQMGTEDDIR
ncbi:MAG TPA: type II secretion system protein [Sandaracinaceae bacterium]